MLLKLFKSNHPVVIILIPVLATLLWLPGLLPQLPVTVQPYTGPQMPAFRLVLELLGGQGQATRIVALVLIIFQAYIIIRLNYKFIFIENKTYLPAVLYVILASALSRLQHLHPVVLANFFLMAAINRTFVISKQKLLLKQYFESGFLIGLGGLFYPPFILVLPVVWFTLFILRSFNGREWFSTLIGFFTPPSMYLAVLFLLNKMQAFINPLNAYVNYNAKLFTISDISFWALVVIGFILIIALFNSLRFIGTKKINTRKYFSLLFWFLALSVAIIIVAKPVGYEFVYVIALPLSIQLAGYFIEVRNRWWSELSFTLLILGILTIIWFQ
jgi:hypothetical protein